MHALPLRLARCRGGLRAAAALLCSMVASSAPAEFLVMAVDETGSPVPIQDGNDGEFYAIQVGPTGPCTDWVVDASPKGGPRIGGLGIASNVAQVPYGAFTARASADHVRYGLITFPDGRLLIGSHDLIGILFMGPVLVMEVGSSPPDVSGLVLPSSGGPYSVDLGAGPVDFPVATDRGVSLAFAPHPETDDTQRGGYTWSGQIARDDPQHPGMGLIRGYNVYRMASASQPTRDEIGRDENFVYHVDLTRFDLAVPDGGPMSSHLVPGGDLAGLQNPDGQAYTGDEVLLFDDTRVNPDLSPRDPPTAAPVTDGTTWWYAVQPVVHGLVDDFASASLSGGVPADWRVDVDGDGTFDAIDFGGDGTDGPEFLSPQADFGIPGLGLTAAGRPLLSNVVEAQTALLPATSQVSLSARLREDGSVRLVLSTGLEEASVLGYDVHRLRDGRRERVNPSLIVADGGTGQSYELEDPDAWAGTRSALRSTRVSARFSERRLRVGPSQPVYEVEIVRRDGRPGAILGPFPLEEVASVRRRR